MTALHSTASTADCALVRAAIRRITLPTAAIPTAIRYWRRRRREGVVPTLVVEIESRDRDDGTPCRLAIRWVIPGRIPTLEHAIDWIYACVRESWVHELNEALFVDGRRRRSLHYSDGQTAEPPWDLIDPWFELVRSVPALNRRGEAFGEMPVDHAEPA